jgi:hypothetical protein
MEPRCDCLLSGRCQQFGYVDQRRMEICAGTATFAECTPAQNQEKCDRYRERWSQSPTPVKHRPRGPGGELKKLLRTVAWLGPKSCSCNKHAAEMDRRGIAWCRANIETIVDWLEAEASKTVLLKTVFSRTVAKEVVLLAIGRAEQNAIVNVR